MKYRLTRAADADIERTLRQTLELFGPRQTKRYSAIINAAISLVAKEPENPACMDRQEIGPGLKSLHLELAAGRRRGAAHILYFYKAVDADGQAEIAIVRLLHECMDAKARIREGVQGPRMTDD